VNRGRRIRFPFRFEIVITSMAVMHKRCLQLSAKVLMDSFPLTGSAGLNPAAYAESDATKQKRGNDMMPLPRFVVSRSATIVRD